MVRSSHRIAIKWRCNVDLQVNECRFVEHVLLDGSNPPQPLRHHLALLVHLRHPLWVLGTLNGNKHKCSCRGGTSTSFRSRNCSKSNKVFRYIKFPPKPSKIEHPTTLLSSLQRRCHWTIIISVIRAPLSTYQVPPHLLQNNNNFL